MDQTLPILSFSTYVAYPIHRIIATSGATKLVIQPCCKVAYQAPYTAAFNGKDAASDGKPTTPRQVAEKPAGSAALLVGIQRQLTHIVELQCSTNWAHGTYTK